MASGINVTKSKLAIGIDLGTTNSCVAVYLNNRVETISDLDTNTRTVPSVVLFTDHNSTVVGSQAKRNPNIENKIFDAKRMIGRAYDDPHIRNDKKSWPFTVVRRNGKPKIVINIDGKKVEHEPVFIQGQILEYLKQMAIRFLGSKLNDKPDAVITVPAYFNDAQKQATLDAAKIAGLNVLHLLVEPTAACVAYKFDQCINLCKTLLIFDFGGGTLDVSIVALKENNRFDVLATDGNSHLGGIDLDNEIFMDLIRKIKQEYNIDLDDTSARDELLQACESAKKALSVAEKYQINIRNLFKDKKGKYVYYSTILTRAYFESLVSNILDNTLDYCVNAINKSGLNVRDIDEVILVGGSSRIPYIQKIISNYFHKKPNNDINGDEAIAHGAALYAAKLMGSSNCESINNIHLADITPLSLGINVNENEMSVIMPRGSKIPSEFQEIYTNKYDNQKKITFKIYEGERVCVTENNYLGEFEIPIEKCPRNEADISVTFKIDTNGILNACAIDRKTGIYNSIQVRNGNTRLTKREIKMMLDNMEKNRKNDELFRQFYNNKNRYETLCYDAIKKLSKRKRTDETCENTSHDLVEQLNEEIKWLNSKNVKNAEIIERIENFGIVFGIYLNNSQQ